MIFPTCLDNDEAEVRWQCLDLIAILVQNNPYCQEAILEAALLPTILEILDKDSNATVKTKALYAVSCEFVVTYFSFTYPTVLFPSEKGALVLASKIAHIYFYAPY